MKKETNVVMNVVMGILRPETSIVLEDVCSIIRAKDETYQAISTVMSILKKEECYE
jgi:hypothetical protein